MNVHDVSEEQEEDEEDGHASFDDMDINIHGNIEDNGQEVIVEKKM